MQFVLGSVLIRLFQLFLYVCVCAHAHALYFQLYRSIFNTKESLRFAAQESRQIIMHENGLLKSVVDITTTNANGRENKQTNEYDANAHYDVCIAFANFQSEKSDLRK